MYSEWFLSWMACAWLGDDGQGQLVPASQWTAEPPSLAPARSMRFLQRYNLLQHGLDLPALLQLNGLAVDQLEGIYSPFFDALLAWPEVPQLITCHDLTPLVASNSRKAWLRYRFLAAASLPCRHSAHRYQPVCGRPVGGLRCGGGSDRGNSQWHLDPASTSPGPGQRGPTGPGSPRREQKSTCLVSGRRPAAATLASVAGGCCALLGGAGLGRPWCNACIASCPGRTGAADRCAAAGAVVEISPLQPGAALRQHRGRI